MATLPTLPSCGQPASVRIEVYSPDPGELYGSLDASAYVCDLHAPSAVSALWRAKLTPRKVTMAPDIERRCGETYVFPTGRLGAPTCRYCGKRGNLIRVTSVYDGDYWSCPPGEHQPTTGGAK